MAANDHYVPQTYLQSFTDPKIGGKLNAYSKRSGRTFQPSTSSVCAERDGDTNAAYLLDPRLRAAYRSIHEGHLATSITAFEQRKATATDRHIVAMFMAALMICTPAWRRVGTQIRNRLWKGRLLIEKEMRAKHGVIGNFPIEGAEMLARGELEIDSDPEYTDARATRDVMATATSLYQEDWVIGVNRTATPLLTSDNPCAIEWIGKAPSGKMYRHLPLSPKLLVSVAHSGRFPVDHSPERIQQVLTTSQEHQLHYVDLTANYVRRLNRFIVQCAEDHVFSPQASEGVRRLVDKYSRYHLDAEYVEMRDGENAVIQGTILKIGRS